MPALPRRPGLCCRLQGARRGERKQTEHVSSVSVNLGAHRKIWTRSEITNVRNELKEGGVVVLTQDFILFFYLILIFSRFV